MNKYLVLLISVTILHSCSGGGSSDKVSQLNELKKQQSSLKEQIARLEAEIAAADTSSSTGKGKLIATTTISPSKFNHYVSIQGRVEGDEDVMVGAETMGTVTSVLVKAGDLVSKGQLLATLDDKIIRQAMDEVQTQLDLATQVYNRQKNLWDQQIGSEIQYLQAKTTKDALEKRVAATREQLDMTKIKSPINGTIDQVMIKAGQAIAPGMPALRVVNLQSLKVVGEVAESYLSTIKSNNEVVVSFPDLNKELTTKLTYAGKVINRLNRTFNVEVILKDNTGTYRPNMVAVLKIVDYSSPNAFIIPIAAVQKSGEGEFVYIVEVVGKSAIAKRRMVNIGMNYNGQTEITSGLQEGDQVITTGYQSVIEGDIVQQ